MLRVVRDPLLGNGTKRSGFSSQVVILLSKRDTWRWVGAWIWLPRGAILVLRAPFQTTVLQFYRKVSILIEFLTASGDSTTQTGRFVMRFFGAWGVAGRRNGTQVAASRWAVGP